MSVSTTAPSGQQTLAQTRRPFKLQIFADGAELGTMVRLYRSGTVDGFTTNPTLMRKAGVTDYAGFARSVLEQIPDVPISFEVFADDLPTMEVQARKISAWGKNVFVKIPIMNTRGESSIPLVRRLTDEGLAINVTAMMSLEQCRDVVRRIPSNGRLILSIFAGRIADTGRDPMPIMREAVALCTDRCEIKVLWASPREVLNVYQADECGCHIVTATSDLLAKLSLKGKDLTEFSRETVQMFYDDARRAGYSL
jgi:transaldolase